MAKQKMTASVNVVIQFELESTPINTLYTRYEVARFATIIHFTLLAQQALSCVGQE